MSKEPNTLRRPSQICIVVGVGVAAIGSFLLALLLGTGYGFGLVLHLILAGLVGWMLAIRCTENDDELFGLVGFFYTPQAREKVTEAAGRLAETAKAQVEKVAEAAKRLPEQVKGAGSSQETSPRATDVSGQETASAASPQGEPMPTQAPTPGTEAGSEADPGTGGEPAPGRKPPLLDTPRGDADDLTRISGIGPRLAAMLNEVGIWHLAQIATWTDEELAWVDSQLGAFRGRARRDDWVGQAKALAADGEPPTAPSAAPGAEDGPADRG